MLALLLPFASATEIVIDDEDGAPAFTTTGSCWEEWSMGSYGHDGGDTRYLYLSRYTGDGSRTGTATWTPTLPQAGTWRIETWFRRTENRTADADHHVTDGAGAVHSVSLDQRGEGGSGWVALGEYTCAAGEGGCRVELDGDDGASDEANAMRFTLVEAEEAEEAPDPCEETPAPGRTTWTLVPDTVDAEGWEDASAAAGEADGEEAQSPNVDAGETLEAAGWSVCEADGATIAGVRLATRARTQYDAGRYEVVLALHAGGEARLPFNGTVAAWHELDLTGDRATWTFADLRALVAVVELEEHPEGQRDSDAWVDAFRLEVDLEVPEPREEAPADTGVDAAPADTGAEPESGAPADTGAPVEPSTPGEEPPAALPGRLTRMDGTGCGSGLAALLPAFALGTVGRRGRRRGA